jgi:formate/nitrite transporter FocA (FNT family)
MNATDNHGIDALLPREIAEKAESVGVQKTRLDAASLFALAVLAGAFIALGGMFATTVLAGADGVVPYGIARLLSGTVFCLGSFWWWSAGPNCSPATR